MIIKQQPEDVAVLDRMDIPGVFKRAKRRLDDEQVVAIYPMAMRSTTPVQQGAAPTRRRR